MGLTVWLCVLCLQASLLSHALDCSGTQREVCVSGHATDTQYDDLPSADIARNQALMLLRQRRQLERRGHTHLRHNSLPGSISVRGFPNTLIQADRARRHLAQAGNKKKSKRKSRVGSFSLLSNYPSTPLQITRARRQVPTDSAKGGRGKSGRTGAFSVLSDSKTEAQNDRPKRGVQKKSAA
ncbi:uncharacterized protein LOC143006897 isoform X1 [Genypterus blacodes]|uniref:uncharacterized protein LOC143006897 isoform X1 n=1 Tax=Genypterus blacodes TaxID=154954 RepID=UPI003F75CF54